MKLTDEIIKFITVECVMYGKVIKNEGHPTCNDRSWFLPKPYNEGEINTDTRTPKKGPRPPAC
jgi:hypothetical protein